MIFTFWFSRAWNPSAGRSDRHRGICARSLTLLHRSQSAWEEEIGVRVSKERESLMAVQTYKGETESGRGILQIHAEGQQAHRTGQQTPSWKEKEKILFWAWQESISIKRTTKGAPGSLSWGKTSLGSLGRLRAKVQGLWIKRKGEHPFPGGHQCPVTT